MDGSVASAATQVALNATLQILTGESVYVCFFGSSVAAGTQCLSAHPPIRTVMKIPGFPSSRWNNLKLSNSWEDTELWWYCEVWKKQKVHQGLFFFIFSHPSNPSVLTVLSFCWSALRQMSIDGHDHARSAHPSGQKGEGETATTGISCFPFQRIITFVQDTTLAGAMLHKSSLNRMWSFWSAQLLNCSHLPTVHP